MDGVDVCAPVSIHGWGDLIFNDQVVGRETGKPPYVHSLDLPERIAGDPDCDCHPFAEMKSVVEGRMKMSDLKQNEGQGKAISLTFRVR